MTLPDTHPVSLRFSHAAFPFHLLTTRALSRDSTGPHLAEAGYRYHLQMRALPAFSTT